MSHAQMTNIRRLAAKDVKEI